MITQHPSPAAGWSQCNAILDRLLRSPGQWVPMPELWRASGAMAVHSRIAELRSRGHLIEHRNLRHGRHILSYYRICLPPAA